MDAEWMSAAFLVIDHTMEQRGHRSDARAQEPDQTRSPSPWSPRTTSRTITTGIARDAPAPVAVWVAAQLALQPAAAPDPPRSGLRADRNDVRSVVLRHNASDEGLRSPAPACGSGRARVRAWEACSSHETLHRAYVLSALKHLSERVGGGPSGWPRRFSIWHTFTLAWVSSVSMACATRRRGSMSIMVERMN